MHGLKPKGLTDAITLLGHRLEEVPPARSDLGVRMSVRKNTGIGETPMQPPQNDGHFVRMLQGVPERLSPLYAFAYGGRLWLVCLSENLPRTICEVDASKETVTCSWKVYDYTYPQAATS